MAAHANGRAPAAVEGGLTTALLYTRVSTDEQAAEGLSLPTQQAATRRYASGCGFLVGGEYQDVLSGQRDDRPSYQALLADVRRLRADGQSVAVIVARLDRFGRRVLERARATEEMRRLNVVVHSVAEGGVLPAFVQNVLAAVAEERVKEISEQVSKVRQEASGKGWFFPGVAPFGYVWREATPEERKDGAPHSVLAADPLACGCLTDFYAKAADGVSMGALARFARTLPAEVGGGRKFSRQAISRMLRSTVYTAPAPARWPAIVPPDLWQRAQAALDRARRVPPQATGEFLLTGFARCGACGSRMSGQQARGGRQRRYRCHGSDTGQCNITAMARPVDKAALESVAWVLAQVDKASGYRWGKGWRERWQQLREPAEPAQDVLADLRRHAALCRTRLHTATERLVDGTMEKGEYCRFRDATQADLANVEGAIAKLTPKAAPQLPTAEDALALLADGKAALTTGGVRAQRRIMADLVDHVTVWRSGGRGEYATGMSWTALGSALHQQAAWAEEQPAEVCE
jgi:DNA invertase Pin-like site-specific DNA recombinase